ERKAKSEIDRALKEVDPRTNPNGEFKDAKELEKFGKEVEGREKEDKRPERKPVTERAGREKQNGEFLDADKLSDLIKDSDAKQRDAQAIHSWEGHENEFRKFGIEDAQQLRRHIEEVRNNPDIHISLKRGRELYAKFDNGKEGTI